MHDIRPDLQDRLNTLDAEKKDLETRLGDVERVRQSIITLIQSEDTRWGVLDQGNLLKGKRPHELTKDRKGATHLSRLLLELLDNERSRSLSELLTAAKERDFPFGEKSPARVLHFALLALKNRGWVERTEDGLWKLPNKSQKQALGNDTRRKWQGPAFKNESIEAS